MSMGAEAGQYAVPDGPKIPQPRNTQTPSDWEDVRQFEPEIPLRTIPVHVEGLVWGHDLPSKRGYWRNHNVGVISPLTGTGPVELVPADPKIKNFWLLSSGTTVLIGNKEQLNKQPSSEGFGPLPNGVLIGPFQGCEEPTFGVSTSGVVGVSVRIEYLAD